MSETQAVARWEKRTPDELIAEGRTQATALMKVVKEAGLAKDLGGQRPHLEVEAWQTIGRFNGFLTDIVWTRPVIEGGEKVGYEARAELVRVDDGQHLIGAEASCFFNEVLVRRDGTEIERWTDDYACRSMAQTRAQSKVGRMAFAWVAVLAGYSGTPAEEMEGVRRGGVKPVVFPFGSHKDKTPADLTADELHKLLPFWESKAAEPGKFQANNQRLLDAIKAAIAEKTAPPESGGGAPPQGEPIPGMGDSPAGPPPDTPPVDVVQEWVDAFDACADIAKCQALWKTVQKAWETFAGQDQVRMTMAKDRAKVRLQQKTEQGTLV